MHPDDEKILRLAKEIAIKFIEIGRISPGNFEEHFRAIYWALRRTVVESRVEEMAARTTPAAPVLED